MQRSLRPCLQPGCAALVRGGYCDIHRPIVIIEDKAKAVKSLRKLDENKTEREIRFYSSGAWVRTSRLYRLKHPLCERCIERGYYHKSELVHHKKELRNIWGDNGNPLQWRYLQALCRACHMEDLRAKKGADNKKKYKY